MHNWRRGGAEVGWGGISSFKDKDFIIFFIFFRNYTKKCCICIYNNIINNFISIINWIYRWCILKSINTHNWRKFVQDGIHLCVNYASILASCGTIFVVKWKPVWGLMKLWHPHFILKFTTNSYKKKIAHILNLPQKKIVEKNCFN